MLRSVSVANFKSIGDSQTLQLAPLTVLAGANNSGKSSLLHAILILAQTLRSSTDDPPLVLDGELFQRGDPRELIHFGRRTFSFAFEADLDSPRFRARPPRGLHVRADATFGLSSGPSWAKQLQVVSSGLTLLDSERQPIDTTRVQRRRRSWRGLMGREQPPWLRPDSLDYMPAAGAHRYPNAVAITLWHFLPQSIIQRLDATSARYQDLLRYIVTPALPMQEDPSLSDDALTLARVLLNNPQLDSLDKLTRAQRNTLRASFAMRPPKSALPLFERFKGDYRWRRRPIPVEEILTSLRALAGTVRHLGPLRLPPQFVYAPTPYAQPGAVGSAGEFTAAELYRSRFVDVDTIDPQTGKPERLPLQDAVATWSRHMGILDGVFPGHRPKIGHYLFVRPPQLTQYVDLTSVGVGASQVLPVLVQAFIAPPGSVLIFEQPELHLHPRVQSILADFFIGLARTGRQCLVETHSEHIVNRIRFRIAEADTPDLLSLSRIYFVERDNGQSQFRPVPINEYGALVDWPAGFFDESDLESERILRSAIQKRSGRES